MPGAEFRGGSFGPSSPREDSLEIAEEQHHPNTGFNPFTPEEKEERIRNSQKWHRRGIEFEVVKTSVMILRAMVSAHDRGTLGILCTRCRRTDRMSGPTKEFPNMSAVSVKHGTPHA
ncbi:hypothetical protein DM02DRAFT_652198 [Periconia macrospinosa]|uniref:Uncharacterized protein n=1 Tax=Periconia macrospinosa TaxID=97972 RepID=A0A2V1E3K4_9PLEO|nr:hypothetical protein DM02DRAFT_652198 [Periconia macrospinosa]